MERTEALQRLWLRPAMVIAALALAAIVPVITKRDDTLNLLFLLFLYITLGQSWNIIGGFTGQTNLGHAAFFGTGADSSRKP